MDELVNAWKDYLNGLNDWQVVVEGVIPKQTQCGPVYEPESPLPERGETFAISDMRDVKVAYPHYHKNSETEIYFVIQGTGLTVVGGTEIALKKGSVVVTPPDTTHFTIPEHDLVMMVINTPKFNAENIVEPTESDPNVKFDKKQYDKLVQNI
jgi:mannose-6-phosphate isomerase-like protein (cupin superfamily)